MRTTAMMAARHWKFVLFFSALVACSSSLSACGFHLRGEVALPAALQRVQVTGTDRHGPLAEEIAAVLASGGGEVTGGDADSVLRILGDGFERRLLTVGADGRPREYEVVYALHFELLAPLPIDAAPKTQPAVLVPAQTITLTRSYAFDAGSVLSMDDEEALLQRELRRRAVGQMMVRLRSVLSGKAAP